MRELKYFVACTVDRFIAREDGSFDFFLAEGAHLTDLVKTYPETVPAHLRSSLGVRPAHEWVDAVLMGRKTYAAGLPFGVTSPYPHLKQYVFSRSMSESPARDVTLVKSDPLEYVRGLKRERGRDIWLCGGGALAAALFPAIDELILKVNPVILGAGIPLFEGPVSQVDLDLAEAKTYPSGFMLARYRMRRSTPTAII
jgi:dihydrofolate reductase